METTSTSWNEWMALPAKITAKATIIIEEILKSVLMGILVLKVKSSHPNTRIKTKAPITPAVKAVLVSEPPSNQIALKKRTVSIASRKAARKEMKASWMRFRSSTADLTWTSMKVFQRWISVRLCSQNPR